jgi:excisionase family DNA binding protein
MQPQPQVLDTGQQIITIQGGHATKLIELYTAREVAAMLRCHWYTVMALARSGKLRGRKIAGKWRFTADQIHQYVQADKPTPRKKA